MSIEVLVVDDHADMRQMLTSLISCFGGTPTGTGDVDVAIELLFGRRVGLVVLDVRLLDGRSGLDLLRAVADRWNTRQQAAPPPPVIVFAADDNAFREATRLGATDCLLKTDVDDLCSLLEAACA